MRAISVENLRFEFGPGGCRVAGAAVRVLEGRTAETLFAEATAAGRRGHFQLLRDGEWHIGVAAVEVSGGLGAAVAGIYQEMLGLAAGEGLRFARIWNYVPAINADGDEGVENYRVFCRERARVFDLAGLGKPPAASAVGGPAGWLVVMFAATKAPALVRENPEQMPAYEYPREYGPRSPSFSRASQVKTNGRRYSFISGTAAIKGHATVAPQSLSGQIDCTLDNLRLISRACGLGEDLAAGVAAERHFKVYLRHEDDLPATREALAERLFAQGDQVSWLLCDICRAELKLEIEATIVG